MSDFYDPLTEPHDAPLDDLDLFEYDDYDYWDCGGTGCGHCDTCDALYEQAIIDEALDEFDADDEFDDYEDWAGGGRTRFKYPA